MKMDKTFTLTCDTCGAKTTIKVEQTMWNEDKDAQYFTKIIKQEGEVYYSVDGNYGETFVGCKNCNTAIDDIDYKTYREGYHA